MKKTMTRLLAMLLILGCFLALTACNEETESAEDASAEEESVASSESKEESKEPTAYTPADGYTLYKKGAISFAYPSDWSLTDGTTPVMTGAGNNNINLVSEIATQENTEMYTSLSEENFMERIGSALVAAGITVSNVNVETKTNDGGVEIILCSYDGTYMGAQMTFYQYLIVGEETHYTITATEVTSMTDVLEELFKSIRVE